MPQQKLRFLMAYAIVAVMSACATKPQTIIIEPEDPEGQACAQQCTRQRLECRMHVDRVRRECERYDNYVNTRYRECLQMRRRAGSCLHLKPQPCISPAVTQCLENHDNCVIGCGGRVRIIE